MTPTTLAVRDLVIAAADLAVLARAAEAAYPEEACALLEGTRGREGTPAPASAPASEPALGPQSVRVSRVHVADNIAGDRRARFEVDPRLLLRLHRTLRDGGTGLVGVWHSHPDGPAVPSATDRAMAWDDTLVWVITPVAHGRGGTPRAWRVAAGAFAEVGLR